VRTISMMHHLLNMVRLRCPGEMAFRASFNTGGVGLRGCHQTNTRLFDPLGPVALRLSSMVPRKCLCGGSGVILDVWDYPWPAGWWESAARSPVMRLRVTIARFRESAP
jgi:hypothetical protein